MINAIVIGASAGGLEALEYLLPHFPRENSLPVFVVQHIAADSDSFYVKMLRSFSHSRVKEACSTEVIVPGTIYFAPPNYHLLIESDLTLTLSSDDKVNYCRPSIDVLFETAAEVYQQNLLGILLTGSNSDGSKGLLRIHELGGKTIVQDPKTAYMAEMPESALRLFRPSAVASLKEIAEMIGCMKFDQF